MWSRYWTYWCCCYELELCMPCHTDRRQYLQPYYFICNMRVLRWLAGLNNFVEWPAIHNRLFTWLSAYRNATGLLYYETDRWFGGNEKAHANDPKQPIAFLDDSSGTSSGLSTAARVCGASASG